MGQEDEHWLPSKVGREEVASRARLADLAARRIKGFGYLYDRGDN